MARITEAQIRELVFAFYDDVRADEVLGPVFEARLDGRWDPHLEKMCDFWSSVLLASGRYRGDPVRVHGELTDVDPFHFDRWIELFDRTARDRLPEPTATDIIGRANRMRVVLERAACATSERPAG